MIWCNLDPNPFYYITSMRVLLAITLPVDLFGVYCIVSKSPPVMKTYSRLLLFYQVLATATDSFTNIIFIPVTFFPFPIGYHEGLLLLGMDFLHIQTIWFCLLVSTTVSVVQLFLFRWQNLLLNGDPLKMNKKLIYATCITFFFLFNAAALVTGLTIGNRNDELRPQYLQNYSCIYMIADVPGINFLELEELRRQYLVTTVQAVIVALASSVLIHLTFRNLRNPNVSQRTIEMQRRFQKSLILQVTIPIAIVIIPGCSSMLTICWVDLRAGGSFAPYVQELLNLSLVLISTHGFFGTVIMIIVNEPYRKFVQDGVRSCLHMCRSRKLEPDRRASEP